LSVVKGDSAATARNVDDDGDLIASIIIDVKIKVKAPPKGGKLLANATHKDPKNAAVKQAKKHAKIRETEADVSTLTFQIKRPDLIAAAGTVVDVEISYDKSGVTITDTLQLKVTGGPGGPPPPPDLEF